MPLASDLTKAIDANLPSEVGKRLQQRLAEADVLENQLANAKHEIAELKPLAQRGHVLDEREKKLLEATRLHEEAVRASQIENARMEIRLDEMKARLKDHEVFIHLLLGNRIFREKIQQAIPVAGSSRVDYIGGAAAVVPSGECVEMHETAREAEER